MNASYSFREKKRPRADNDVVKKSDELDTARAARIKYVRVDVLKLRNQEDLADAISKHTGKPLSRGAVGNWERGAKVGIKHLSALANISGISVEWLLNGGRRPTARKSVDKRMEMLSGDEFDDIYEIVDAIIQRRMERHTKK